jgi:arabinose-5-phosphate isomerase
MPKPGFFQQSPSESSAESVTVAAREGLAAQAAALLAMSQRLDETFERALTVLGSAHGRIVVTGVGKSGLIGRSLAATLASTGSPAMFVHAGDALHGDLGMITPQDVVLLLSYSGEPKEIVNMLPYLEQRRIPSVALVGRASSTLARFVDVAIDIAVERELCPHNLAPTTSTVAMLSIGNVLAMGLMRRRNFSALDFAQVHPGGHIGHRTASLVRDAMHKRALPIVTSSQSIRDSLFTITRGRLGLALVCDGDELRGIVTDGDLRRAMQRHEDVLDVPVASIMSGAPICIREDAPIWEAEQVMQHRKVKALVVKDSDGDVAGIFDIFQT